MARDIPVSNGRMLVDFDLSYNLRDIFFPSIGQENHTGGKLCRTGIWVDGQFSWLNSPEWEKSLRYRPESLVTEAVLTRQDLGIRITFNDAVDFDRNLFLRRATVANLTAAQRKVRLYFHYDFHLYGLGLGDTVYYDPTSGAIVAYKGRRYFIASGRNSDSEHPSEWTTGQAEMGSLEGTWRDAEDGHLEGNPIAQGSVDTTMSVHLTIPPLGESPAHHWLGAGTSLQEVETLNRLVHERGPDSFIDRTEVFWRAWVNKDPLDFWPLPASTIDLYKRSLLVLRTHTDDRGGIISSVDWDITDYNRDTYCYVWPRDAALVAMAFSEAGHAELARSFFRFCQGVVTRQGYFRHKYGPLGDVASSWHPFVDHEGRPQLPIQEDETGLVLYALWRHYLKWRDFELIVPLYRGVIKNGADFMVGYRHRATGLPAPSFDLWEERWGIHTFTVAAVWAGLQAAAFFTQLFNEQELSEHYLQAAREIRAAALVHLFDSELNRFVRGLHVTGDGATERDTTLDSSLCALFKFGMFAAEESQIASTIEALRLRCQTPVGGLARYEGDSYFRVQGATPEAPGNPWLISTMWLAQYYISRAHSEAELEPALDLLKWAERHAFPSGVFSEQYNPYTGAPLSVSPLMWSHGEYVLTVQQYLQKHRELVSMHRA